MRAASLTGSNDMEAWEVLERAADKIERDGWAQGDKDGVIPRESVGHCASTAITETCYGKDDTWLVEASMFGVMTEAESALEVAIGGNDISSIFEWNDEPGRTAEEVIAMLRACAASLKAARTEATRQHAPESTVAEVATGDATALEHAS